MHRHRTATVSRIDWHGQNQDCEHCMQDRDAYGKSRIEAEQIFGWHGRPVCAPGQGAVAGLHEGSRPAESKWFRSGTSRTASTTSSAPSRLRCAQAADAAVKALGWKLPYFCDADHITADDGGSLSRAVRLFHLRCGRLYRPARAGSGHRELREAASGAAGKHRAGGSRRGLRDYAQNS